MTVPAVPNRSPENLERGALPFRAFPLPLGGNVGNALHNAFRARLLRLPQPPEINGLTRLWPPEKSKVNHART